jgi:DNA-binding transcriptional LysR family regulator
VELGHNDRILENLINGSADFGIVTEMVQHVALRYEPFCHEEYVLVSGATEPLEELNPDAVLQRKFICYPCMGTYFNTWVRHHMPDLPNIDARSLSHAGEINSIVGAVAMVVGGLGFGVFPRHCVQREIDAGRLYEHNVGNVPVLMNDLYIVRPSSTEQPRRVEKIIEWLADHSTEH